MRLTVPGEPIAKGRARAVPIMRDGRPVVGMGGRPVLRQYTPERTSRYENLVKLAAQQQMGAVPPLEGPISLTVCAVFAIPASWSNRKRAAADGMPVTKRPDLDNVVKAIKDGLNGVAWADDSQVAVLTAVKVYGACPRVEIEIEVVQAQQAQLVGVA